MDGGRVDTVGHFPQQLPCVARCLNATADLYIRKLSFKSIKLALSIKSKSLEGRSDIPPDCTEHNVFVQIFPVFSQIVEYICRSKGRVWQEEELSAPPHIPKFLKYSV